MTQLTPRARVAAAGETSPRRATGGRSQAAIPFPSRASVARRSTKANSRRCPPAGTEAHAVHLRSGPCSSCSAWPSPPRGADQDLRVHCVRPSKRRQAKLAPRGRLHLDVALEREVVTAGRWAERPRDPVVAAPRLDRFLLRIVDVPVPVGEADLLARGGRRGSARRPTGRIRRRPSGARQPAGGSG